MDKKRKSISDEAFMNRSTIVSVSFGSQCVHIGSNAFKNCISLEKINEDNEIESIGENAFARTKLSSVIFSRLNNLNTGAFERCPNLTYVNIPNYINILSLTFAGCTNLTHIDIPQCSETIGTSAFKECENLKIVNNNAKLPFQIYDYAFCSCYNLSDIYFDGCTSIGDSAFTDCKNLNMVDLNKCVSIGESAFAGCTNISQITISICEMIGSNAFANCTNLSKVYINNPSSIFCKLGNKYVFCTHDIASICSINSNITFYFKADSFDKYKEDSKWNHYADNMKMTIQDNQIIYTTNNNEIISINNNDSNPITKNEYYINYGLLEFESKLTSFNTMFQNSDTLTSVNIPYGCEIIESNAFENCINLCEVHFDGSEPPKLGDNVFGVVKEDFKIFVPEDSLSKYNLAWETSEYLSYICSNI